MEFLYYFAGTFFVFYFFHFHNKKLACLLILEGMMICLVLFLSMFHLGLFYSTFIMLFFSCFMVLDSVFGIALIISGCRTSSLSNSSKILL